MSQHQLREAYAQASLDQAIGMLDSTAPKPEGDQVDYGSSWHDRLICEVVRREAEALLGVAKPSAAASQEAKP